MDKNEITVEKPERNDFYAGVRTCEHAGAAAPPRTPALEVPNFDGPECEAKFRRALRGVASKTFIRNAGGKITLYVRPDNLLEFGASVNRLGLENCPTTRKILRYLDQHKAEFLRFEHAAKN